MPALDRLAQQQIGHIGAGDGQHEADGSEQQEQGGLAPLGEIGLERFDQHCVASVNLGIFGGEAGGDQIHLAGRRTERNARGQPGEGPKVATVAAGLRER